MPKIWLLLKAVNFVDVLPDAVMIAIRHPDQCLWVWV